MKQNKQALNKSDSWTENEVELNLEIFLPQKSRGNPKFSVK